VRVDITFKRLMQQKDGVESLQSDRELLKEKLSPPYHIIIIIRIVAKSHGKFI